MYRFGIGDNQKTVATYLKFKKNSSLTYFLNIN